MSETTAADPGMPAYLLRLYVAGTTSLSVRAAANVRKLCESYLSEAYDLQILDICQRPTLAAGMQLFVAPTLVKVLPLPERRFVGDMSRTDWILDGLGVRAPTRSAESG